MNVESTASQPEVTIVVPARNEEACLGDCLASLVAQEGARFEIIVVDDHSTDRTRQIATGFPGVRVISAAPLSEGWTGKNNAVVSGAAEARGDWLLFTDADTVHLPGSLSRALEEAKKERVDLLSYSPEQIAISFWEMATLPVVFAELARQYPPKEVTDPALPIAAANGQFILIRRSVYDIIGGHTAIARELLEDVALARAVKSSGRRIRFRYAADAVRTRMYRNFRQLREGWTKNLAILFPQPGWLAIRTLLMWGLPWVLLLCPLLMRAGAEISGRFESLTAVHRTFLFLVQVTWDQWLNPFVVLVVLLLAMRLRRANFTWDMEVLGTLFGYPMFAYLLLRSRKAHRRRMVSWKGRTYSNPDSIGDNVSKSVKASTGMLRNLTSETRQ